MHAFSEWNVFGEALSLSANEVGFFSIAIWTGILTMSVVVAMLVFAIDMTYSIQTMDRFDSLRTRNLQING